MRSRVELANGSYVIVELSDDGEYVISTSVGDLTRDDGIEITRAMYSLAATSGVNCILADARKARNTDRPIASVRHATEDIPRLPDVDFSRVCVALLVDPADHSHDFYASFMTSQGIDTTLFWDYDKAVEHLRQAATYLNEPAGRDSG